MKKLSFCLAGLVLLTPAVWAAFVTVGNPGNAHDTSPAGYGGVAYEYQISAYEVTAGEYAAFLNAVDPNGTNPNSVWNSSMDSDVYGCQITRNLSNPVGSRYDFSGRPSGSASDWTSRPVNFVSWYDALRYANWLTTGNTETGVYTLTGPTTVSSIMDHQLAATTFGTAYFLPTENEWYKAAYYSPSGVYYDYPTGSNTKPGYVTDSGNLSGGGVFSEGGVDPGRYATYNGDIGTGGPTWGIGPNYYRTNVGEWENSPSPYGTFDQGGNVAEMTETFYDATQAINRGGPYQSDHWNMQSAYRTYGNATSEHHFIGFRVASMTGVVPEPGAAALVLLGGLWLVVRRRNATPGSAW
jgi:formylglycine-generating enzyme required for sulfatase activity